VSDRRGGKSETHIPKPVTQALRGLWVMNSNVKASLVYTARNCLKKKKKKKNQTPFKEKRQLRIKRCGGGWMSYILISWNPKMFHCEAQIINSN
jgi:hypothetical protein